jgi:hypothetical protein
MSVLKHNSKTTWSNIPERIREIVSICLSIDIQKTDDIIRFIDTLWSMGKLRCHYQSLSPHLKSAIINKVTETIKKDVGPEVSRLLYSLSAINIRWSDIAHSCGSSIDRCLFIYLKFMNDVEVVNTVYALGKMKCIWIRDISSGLRKELVSQIIIALETSGQLSLSNTIW